MAFDDELEDLIVSKKGKYVKFTPVVVDKLKQLILRSSECDKVIASHHLHSDKFFEEFLWPKVSDKCTDNALLVVWVCVVSRVQSGKRLHFNDDDRAKVEEFVFRSVQVIKNDQQVLGLKVWAIRFIRSLISSLDIPVLRKVLEPAFSIASWRSLKHKPLDKFDLQSSYDAMNEKLSKLTKRQAIIYNTLSLFVHDLCSSLTSLEAVTKDNVRFYKEIMSTLSLILSQLPTRRFSKTIIEHSNALQILKFRKSDLGYTLELFEYFLKFPLDEFTGEMETPTTLKARYDERSTTVISYLFTHFSDKLGSAILDSSAAIAPNLQNILLKLDPSDIEQMLIHLKLSTTCPDFSVDALSYLVLEYLSPPETSSQTLKKYGYLPMYQSLVQLSSISPFELPNLNSQLLSLSDALVRTYIDVRFGAFNNISNHIVRTVSRFKKTGVDGKLTGSSRHAIKLGSYSVESTVHFDSKLDSIKNTRVTLPVELGNSQASHVSEWNDIKTGDVILLVKLGDRLQGKGSFEKCGIENVCSLHVESVANKNGSKKLSSNSRSFLIHAIGSHEENFENMNLLLKLPEALKDYFQSLKNIETIVDYPDSTLEPWFVEQILGYGDHNAGNFTKLDHRSKLSLKSIPCDIIEEALKDFELDWQHDSKKRRVDDEIKKSYDAEIIGKQVTLKEGTYQPSLNYTPAQLRAIVCSSLDGLTIVRGAAGSGKRSLASHIILSNIVNHSNERILVVTKNEITLDDLMDKVIKLGVKDEYVFSMTDTASQEEKVKASTLRITELLGNVGDLASLLDIHGAHDNDPLCATNFWKYELQPLWELFLHKCKSCDSSEALLSCYPFKSFGKLNIDGSQDFNSTLKAILGHYCEIANLFEEIERLGPLSFLTSKKSKAEYLLTLQAKVIGVTASFLEENFTLLQGYNVHYSSILFAEASQLNIHESILPFLVDSKGTQSRVIMIGDELNLGPSVLDSESGKVVGLSTSLFEQLINKGAASITLSSPEGPLEVEHIIVDGSTEEPETGFYHNLQECNAIIDYISTSNEDLTVLTPFEGQRAPLQMMVDGKFNGKFTVQTVESFRGCRSNTVIVSMVRTGNYRFDEKLIHSIYQSAISKLVIVCSPAYKRDYGFVFV